APPSERPCPVAAAVEGVGEGPDLRLHRPLPVEVAGGREGAGEEERGVDGGQLAATGPPAGPHVEEVVVEAAVARGVGGGALRALVEEPERGGDGLGRLAPRQPPRLGRDGEAGEPEPDGRDRA